MNMKQISLFLVSMTLIPTTHAASFFSTLTPPSESSGTVEKIQIYANQYLDVDRILREHTMTKNTKTKLISEKNRISKSIKELKAQHDSEKWEPGTGGYSINPKLKFYDIQSYHLSCESSATATILNYLGKTATEDDVIAKLAPHFYGIGLSSTNIWWDPDLGFVGDINGGQRKLTGFGVYEKPITKIYRQYNLNTKIMNNLMYAGLTDTGSHLTSLLSALESWDGVQMWWDYCTSKDAEDGILIDTNQILVDTFGLFSKNTCSSEASARTLTWNTYDSNLNTKPITALNGEHNFVLLGWKWSKENPTHIIVWDTFTGKHVYPTSEWLKKWGAVNNRSIIVSKKK